MDKAFKNLYNYYNNQMSSSKRLDELWAILIEETLSIMPSELYDGQPWVLSLALIVSK